MTNIHPITFKKAINDIIIGGCSLTELAATYNTPLYIIDEATIIKNCQLFTHLLSEHYPNFCIAYASKAGLNIGLSNLMASNGIGADVVSGGELYTVLNSNVDRNQIYFHGNNKSKEELALAIDHDIRLVVDNTDELHNISRIAQEKNKKALLMFRIKPGIEAHTHEYIKTGHIDSKFGLPFNEALPLIQATSCSDWGDFIGIHAHIGSQIFDTTPYMDLVAILVNFIKTIQEDLNVSVKEVNCGGGFGVSYTKNDQAPDVSDIILAMANELKLLCDANRLSHPKLIFEPGRSIIAQAGVTLYTVGAVKPIANHEPYVFVDGGMADNPRPMMYQSEYTFDIVAPSSDHRDTYTIAGKFCESGDILAKHVELPLVEKNQLLVVYGTGAYNYSMSSNYNRFCKPAMVAVHNGAPRILVKRESYKDIIQYDAV
jgi:diaminopimelate decarboxylase